ncbi:hypothetical protein FT663_02713 [Candidozyma haemuli var. vulneris]|uniref:MICOS complex subunit MIC12 n=1 Tax=Candidozyma haemuli TaxID=45357 RepID=A0A2V1AN27_9ASCO|nr:hypothetical protein CXQ85_001418 [[Candida] haemuloni]KAF3989620.1 hypothetical protein FT662_02699 [[Candida] haemuloni var. vulneris]KAF3991415.1 hypothetical protein FT663_02713 [[Candida] haemuloni var. vulneris]PVH19122.1 hypothetical protein CXQ85_001418 [[Candida] haemuloni]
MGGRIIGFLAGVTATGAVFSATKGLMQKMETFNHTNFTEMKDQIENRILTDKGIDKNPQPPNRRVTQLTRPSILETCKDYWNEEFIQGVNWVYSINWYQWGLDADRKLNKLTDKLTRKIAEAGKEEGK